MTLDGLNHPRIRRGQENIQRSFQPLRLAILSKKSLCAVAFAGIDTVSNELFKIENFKSISESQVH